jgi:capsular exopolysaccharide synthesis family protein
MQAKPNQQQQQSDSKLHFLDYWRIIRIRKTVILAVFLLVVLTTTIITFLLKPTYASSVRIAIEKDSSDITPLMGYQVSQQHDPYWVLTEYEKIQSKKVLHPVIHSLGLNRKWMERFNLDAPLTTNETFQVLKKSIDVDQYRNTSLIEIKAYSQDKEEAAQIAQEIAEQYKAVREQNLATMATSGIDVLKEELRLQKIAVSKKQEELDKIRAELNISDIYSAEGSPIGMTTEPQVVMRLEQERTVAEAKWIRYRTLFDELKVLTFDELKNTILTAMPGNLRLTHLLNEYDTALQTESRLKELHGPEHPQMKSIRSLLVTLNQQLTEELTGVLRGLQSQVNAAKNELNQIKEAVEEAKKTDAEETKKYRPYFTAKRELEGLSKISDMIQIRILQETVDAQLPNDSIVEIYDHAEPNDDPVRPKVFLNIALGVVVGLIVGVGLAFFIEYLDTSVKTIDDVEQALQAPVLGVIPQNVQSLLLEGPDSPHAEAYRVLRTNILFSRKDQNANTLTVVSGGAGEGKSTTIFNLAAIFAQHGSRVLIVDSDLRRPSLHKHVGVSNAIGLTDFLLGQKQLEEVVQTTKQEGLDFLPSGKLPSSSMGILNSTQMKEFIVDARKRYDFVFFDSPPIMGVSDASVLASEVDMAILVIQYRKYPQAMTIRAKQMVEKVGGNLLGVVLNNINISQDSYYYYYSGYYYDYYSKQDEAEGKSKKKKSDGKSGKTSARGDVELKNKF